MQRILLFIELIKISSFSNFIVTSLCNTKVFDLTLALNNIKVFLILKFVYYSTFTLIYVLTFV